MIAQFLIFLVRSYQRFISPDQGLLHFFFPVGKKHCVMYPSCSHYMILSIQKYGPFRGFLKGLRRITRCHPYQKQLIDLP